MKKYIYIVLILIASTFAAYFPIEMSIRKDAQLKIEEDSVKYREEAIRELDKIFEGKGFDGKGAGGFGCVLYYNYIPNYALTSLTGLGRYYNDKEFVRLFRLNELKKVYKLSPNADMNNVNMQRINDAIMLGNADIGERDNLFKPLNGNNMIKAANGIWQSGWAIGYADRIDEDSYVCFIIHPDWVGSTSGSMNNYEISKALESTLDFYLNNKRSNYYGYIDNKSVSDFMSLALARIGARLNHFENDSTLCMNYNAIDYINIGTSNVHITCSNKKGYKLKYCNEYDKVTKDRYIEESRNKVTTAFFIAISILLIFLVVLLVFNARVHKRIKQTALQRIIRHSKPNLYLKEYDCKKVEIANSIYKKALSTDESDESAILELCDRIENDLGVTLIEKTEIRDLQNRCNPKKFINPYNAEKLEKANNLFAILQEGVIGYRSLVAIRKEVDKLYNDR